MSSCLPLNPEPEYTQYSSSGTDSAECDGDGYDAYYGYDADYDYAESLLRLSVFGFSRLSPSDQQKKTDNFLCEVVEDVAELEQLPEESKEGFRLRTFTELFTKLPLIQQHHLVIEFIKNFKQEIKAHVNDQSFAETFLSFSIICFKGKMAFLYHWEGEEFSNRVEGVIIDHQKLPEESEKDFNLRRFTELHKKADFGTQMHFISKVKEYFVHQCLPETSHFLPSQDSASAAELLSRFSISAFCLLSEDDQLEMIEKISSECAEGTVAIQRLAEESEEDFRNRTFTNLYNKAPVFYHVHLFEEHFAKKFYRKRRLSEGEDEEEGSNQDSESEVRCAGVWWVRAFITAVMNFLGRCNWRSIRYAPAEALSSSLPDQDELKQFRYAFFCDVASIWFKTRCANHRQNPIQELIYHPVGDEDFEQRPDETEEDSKLLRFTESFKQLPFSSQKNLVKKILQGVYYDIGGPNLWIKSAGLDPTVYEPELSSIKIPDLRAVTTTAQGGGAQGSNTQGGQGSSTQGGQGTGQGTSNQ